MKSGFLGPNVACVEATHLTQKQVLFMVFRSYISMLNGMA